MRFILPLLCCVLYAVSQTGAQAADKNPVSIEASEQMEWIQDKALYSAKGDVVVTQGDMTLRADLAEAHYDPEQGPSALTRIVATGHVVMTNGAQTVYADRAEYDTRTTLITVYGQPVRLETASQKITAQNSMTYNATERTATASGGATIIDAGNMLKADTVRAWIAEDGKTLQRADATGHVVITHHAANDRQSSMSIAQADRAQYDATRDVIDLKGNVKLTRDNNHMQGDAAHVDLKTGHSTLQNNPSSGGRVRAVFTPGADGNTPLPNVNTGIPIIPGKKNPEMPYQVGDGINGEQRKSDYVGQ